MQNKMPVAAVVIDRRHQHKTGNYPVKLRITYNAVQKYYRTGIILSDQDFKYAQNPSLIPRGVSRFDKDRFVTLGLEMSSILARACEILKQLSRFSFNNFESVYYSDTKDLRTLASMYEAVISELKVSGRLGTASNYHCSLASLKEFYAKIDFSDVTPSFLQRYEKWLLSQGKSVSTVGIYLRPLRAIVNSAIELKIIPREEYPFGKRRYQIPACRNIKKCLSSEELRLISEYKPLSGTWWEKAKDFWLFSFMANGMNIKDIALLKHEDVQGDYIRFVRAKTANTSRASSREIGIHISAPLREIIEKWKSCNGPYLFSIVSTNMTAEGKRKAIMQFNKMVNTYIQRIGKEVGIEKKITSYFARHSFATLLLKSGISTEIISDSLGHSSIKTTAAYLGSFENETRERVSQILIKSFRK